MPLTTPLTSQSYGNALLLDGGGNFIAFLENSHQEFSFETVVLKFVSFSPGHILRGYTIPTRRERRDEERKR